MKLGIVIYADDMEAKWNAFRQGNFTLDKGVEAENLLNEKFNGPEQMGNTCLWHVFDNKKF